MSFFYLPLVNPKTAGGDEVSDAGDTAEGMSGKGDTAKQRQPVQPAFVISGMAAVIKEALAHPGGKAAGESEAFLRVLAEMSADAAPASGPVADHHGSGGGGNAGAGEAGGADGSGAEGGNGDQGGAGVAAIDDAEAFHLKTVRVLCSRRLGGGGVVTPLVGDLGQKVFKLRGPKEVHIRRKKEAMTYRFLAGSVVISVDDSSEDVHNGGLRCFRSHRAPAARETTP